MMYPFGSSRLAIRHLSRFNKRLSSPDVNHFRNFSAITFSILQPDRPSDSFNESGILQNPKSPKLFSPLNRYFHFTREAKLCASISTDPAAESDYSGESAVDDGDEDEVVNDFLSRFVWIMRGKITEASPDLDKKTVDAMLLVIIQKVVEAFEKGGLEEMLSAASTSQSEDFSEDLWQTVWEVSTTVVKDMEKESKKERMKRFLQAKEVMEMCKFAGEIGVRGDLLRELRFKWAKEEMEDKDFYESLERLRQEAKEEEVAKNEVVAEEEEAAGSQEEKPRVISLPKRKGKLKYTIYGLDLSDKKWVETADKIHEAEEIAWPQEAKEVSGKCKLVMEKLISLKEQDDPSALLAEWIELLQPNRVDWMALLDRLQERNSGLYLKVAEHVLDESSFQANDRDYSKLINTHAKENRLEETERLLKKMDQKGIAQDILTATALVHMYSKSGNIDGADKWFKILKLSAFQPDISIYNSMILAYVRSGEARLGESLLNEMDKRELKPSEEVYMALLRSFTDMGDVNGATRISNSMRFSGIKPSSDSCSLLVEAYGKLGDPDQARSNFDYMIKLGMKPDDKCIASMIQAYESKNMLDKALNLLLKVEKDGYDIGANTYTVLVDWMGRLGLIDEAEQLLGKISQQGEAPPIKIHVSLCNMYSRAKNEKKTLQTLQVLKSKKEQLGADEFKTVITGLIAGGFVQDAKRMSELMESRGFVTPDLLKMPLAASQAYSPLGTTSHRRS